MRRMCLRDLYNDWAQLPQIFRICDRSPDFLCRLPTEASQQGPSRTATIQTAFFRAATGKAFTTFFAGLAFTITTLPKISFLPAFVAGFVLVLRRHRPGRANPPVFFTSVVAISARLSSTFPM